MGSDPWGLTPAGQIASEYGSIRSFLYTESVRRAILFLMPFHRTTVEIDSDALATAELVLGTRGIKDTVNGALREVGRRDALNRAAEYVLKGELHVPDEASLAAWREPQA